MTSSPAARKLLLTAHVMSSVGWFGAVAAFFALGLTALFGHNGGHDGGHDVERARAACIALDDVTWFTIVPLCGAAFVTGIVQALVTPWGLFRHYWVLAKLVLTVAATIGLFIHTMPIGELARAATQGRIDTADAHDALVQIVIKAGGALIVLGAATVFSIFKPKGTTSYGRRKLREARSD